MHPSTNPFSVVTVTPPFDREGAARVSENAKTLPGDFTNYLPGGGRACRGDAPMARFPLAARMEGTTPNAGVTPPDGERRFSQIAVPTVEDEWVTCADASPVEAAPGWVDRQVEEALMAPGQARGAALPKSEDSPTTPRTIVTKANPRQHERVEPTDQGSADACSPHQQAPAANPIRPSEPLQPEPGPLRPPANDSAFGAPTPTSPSHPPPPSPTSDPSPADTLPRVALAPAAAPPRPPAHGSVPAGRGVAFGPHGAEIKVALEVNPPTPLRPVSTAKETDGGRPVSLRESPEGEAKRPGAQPEGGRLDRSGSGGNAGVAGAAGAVGKRPVAVVDVMPVSKPAPVETDGKTEASGQAARFAPTQSLSVLSEYTASREKILKYNMEQVKGHSVVVGTRSAVEVGMSAAPPTESLTAGTLRAAPVPEAAASLLVERIGRIVESLAAESTRGGTVKVAVPLGADESIDLQVTLKGGVVHTLVRTQSQDLQQALRAAWTEMSGQMSGVVRSWIEPQFVASTPTVTGSASPSSSGGDSGQFASFSDQSSGRGTDSDDGRARRSQNGDAPTASGSAPAVVLDQANRTSPSPLRLLSALA